MKTAPFDLEKALAGHPLVTRGGRRVTEFHRRSEMDFHPSALHDSSQENYPFAFHRDPVGWLSCDANGRWLGNEAIATDDLFLLIDESASTDRLAELRLNVMRAKVALAQAKLELMEAEAGA